MPNTSMQPTIGRVVHYKSYGTPNGEYKSEPRAAIVTAVHFADQSTVVESVDLCILNPTGMFFAQNLKKGSEPGQWDWMPFQKDQQKRYGLDSESESKE